MFVFKYENDSYGIPYLIATRFSPAGVNPFPVMAGLLTRPSRRAFPALHQWQVAATLRGLTAAGTVPDSHRIPYYLPGKKPFVPYFRYSVKDKYST